MKRDFVRGAILMCLFPLLAFLVSGCSRVSSSQTNPQDEVVTMWHWLSDKEDLLESLAEQFTKETGIKVKVDVFGPTETYKQKVIASAQTNVLPDIFGVLGDKKDFANFIKVGYVKNLTPYFEENDGEWVNRFYPDAIKTVSFSKDNEYGIKPGIYGVPLDMVTIQFVYNKDILKQAGLDPEKPPQTMQEFLKAVRTIKEKVGVDGLVTGFGELWLVECMASNFAWNVMGEEKMVATYRGEVKYTDPDWIRVFEVFEKMRKAGVFIPGIVIKSNKEAERDFARGKTAFAFNGSWCVNVYKHMNSNLHFGTMLPPKISDANPVGVWGGAGTFFVVNGKSPRAEKAIKFLKWLTEKDQQIRFVKDANSLPAVKGCEEFLAPEVRGFLKAMDFMYHPRNFPVQEDPLVVDTFCRGIQGIIVGEKTPREVAEEVQKVKERQLKKRARR